MEELLKQKLDEVFKNYPTTSETKDLYDEVLANLRDAAKDQLNQGFDEATAVQKAFEKMGDLTEVLNELTENQQTVQIHINSENPHFSQYLTDGLGKLALANQVTFSPDEIDSLSIEYRQDNVQILSSDDEDLHLLEYMNSDKPEYLAHVSQNGTELKIVAGERPVLFGLPRPFRTKIILQIPEGILDNLSISITSGNLKVEEVSLNKQLEVACKSGNVKLAEIACKQADFHLTSGNLVIEDLDAPLILADVTSGNLKLEDLSAQHLEIKATSGNLVLSDLDVEALKLEAASGNVKLADIESDNAQIQAHSGFLTVEDSHFKNIEMTATSGGINFSDSSFSKTGRFQSKNGNVKLDLTDMADFDFELESGHGLTQLDFSDCDYRKKTQSYKLGTVGAGGVKLSASTKNGNVVVNNEG